MPYSELLDQYNALLDQMLIALDGSDIDFLLVLLAQGDEIQRDMNQQKPVQVASEDQIRIKKMVDKTLILEKRMKSLKEKIKEELSSLFTQRISEGKKKLAMQKMAIKSYGGQGVFIDKKR